jgi:lipid II isoglutaminyl synthase (glutamine-hydrolysing)
MTRGSGTSARTLVAITSAKTAAAVSRRLGRGGTSLPGLVAERLDPGICSKIAPQFGHGCILVTGTNGKTTTSRMLAEAARVSGLRVVHNRSGSNLMRGVTATLVEAAGMDGRINRASESIGVFEIDEATLPAAVRALGPRAVVFTNLFRDQLDRYGEVDSISALWNRSLGDLKPDAVLLLNADDPSVAGLADAWNGKSLAYGIDDPRQAAEVEHAADSRWCNACGAEYVYSALYFGHLGVWGCPGCGRSRPEPAVRARCVEFDGSSGTRFRLETPSGNAEIKLALDGLYNVYNALAACAGGIACELPLADISTALESFGAVFGRQEEMVVRGRRVQILLCKNPAGTNQILRLIASRPAGQHLLILLNDGIADGRDVSWIWDVDYETLGGQAQAIVVSGSRAADMALRLKYAGTGAQLIVEADERKAIDAAVAMTPVGECLTVLPTYTAMLAVRERLATLAGRSRFWED